MPEFDEESYQKRRPRQDMRYEPGRNADRYKSKEPGFTRKDRQGSAPSTSHWFEAASATPSSMKELKRNEKNALGRNEGKAPADGRRANRGGQPPRRKPSLWTRFLRFLGLAPKGKDRNRGKPGSPNPRGERRGDGPGGDRRAQGGQGRPQGERREGAPGDEGDPRRRRRRRSRSGERREGMEGSTEERREGRPDRGDRPDRGPRPDRPERSDRGPRPERTDRGPREDRGPRPDRAPREDRGPRSDRGPREDRGPRREREPRGPSFRDDRRERGEGRPPRQDDRRDSREDDSGQTEFFREERSESLAAPRTEGSDMVLGPIDLGNDAASESNSSSRESSTDRTAAGRSKRNRRGAKPAPSVGGSSVGGFVPHPIEIPSEGSADAPSQKED
jgi:hypothetical protein